MPKFPWLYCMRNAGNGVMWIKNRTFVYEYKKYSYSYRQLAIERREDASSDIF